MVHVQNPLDLSPLYRDLGQLQGGFDEKWNFLVSHLSSKFHALEQVIAYLQGECRDVCLLKINQQSYHKGHLETEDELRQRLAAAEQLLSQ